MSNISTIEKDNTTRYNEVKTLINTLDEKNSNLIAIPNVKSLISSKIITFSDYCNENGVLFFSELPVSDLLLASLIANASNCIDYKNKLIGSIDEYYKLKIKVPFITKKQYERYAHKMTEYYLTLYSLLECTKFELACPRAYKLYYEEFINDKELNEDLADKLEDMLKRDNDIMSKLKLSESFELINSNVEATISKCRKKICKNMSKNKN